MPRAAAPAHPVVDGTIFLRCARSVRKDGALTCVRAPAGTATDNSAAESGRDGGQPRQPQARPLMQANMTPDPDHIDPAAAGGDPAPGFHMLAKPGGSSCNIDCSYCFFLSKEALYPERRQHMSDQTLETYIRQLLQAHTSAQVQVAWQGGEPTLMQLPFFARAVELVEQYRRPDQVVEHSIQTNGTLIDEDWCRFLKQHRFLVGLSVDGPRALHDRYRVDRLGQGTFERVMRGWRL